MAACDDDSESPSGSGLRSVSSRSFFWPYGAPHRKAFFLWLLHGTKTYRRESSFSTSSFFLKAQTWTEKIPEVLCRKTAISYEKNSKSRLAVFTVFRYDEEKKNTILFS